MERFRRVLGPVRAEAVLAVAVAAAATVYALFALIRFDQLAYSGFDLGIFDQTVWHYSRFETPANTVRSLEHIWGDHFSPILMLLAPLYWLWDDVRELLLAQAALLAAAAVPIFLYARERLGRPAGLLLAIAYLCFWGVQSALAWEFHELAFAPLLIALVLLAVQRRRWGTYFGLLLALLCVKEDMSIVVVFLGLYLLTLRAWLPAAATIVLGVVWYLLVVRLLIPHFSPTGDYAYWSYDTFGSGPLPAIGRALTDPGLVLETLFGSAAKRETLLFLFAPLLGLCLLSRTAILLAPLVAQRFLSDNPQYWVTDYHYTLTMAAILFVGAADGLANLLRLAPRARPRLAAPIVAAAILVANLAFLAATDGRTGGAQKLWAALEPASYATSAYVEAARSAVDTVPPEASVAAQDNVLPLLTQRQDAAEILSGAEVPDYVVAHVLDAGGRGTTLNGGFVNVSRFVSRAVATHDPVAYFDGWLVLRARSLGPAPRAPQLPPVGGAGAEEVRTAYDAWIRSAGAYGPALLACGEDADCARGLGGAFRRDQARLDRALAGVEPDLEEGCAQLGPPARRSAAVIAQALEATRQADAAGLVTLAELNAVDASGFVTRFAALCAPE